MSARVLLPGVLQRIARKTSSGGKPYLLATIREGNGDSVRWWTVFAFRDPAIEELERLSVGDAVAVTGAIEAKIYSPNGGEAKVSLSVTADAVISTRASKKEPKRQKEGPAPSTSTTEREELNDAIPF